MFLILSFIFLCGAAVVLLKAEQLPQEQQDVIIRGVWAATFLFGTAALIGMLTWK